MGNMTKIMHAPTHVTDIVRCQKSVIHVGSWEDISRVCKRVVGVPMIE